MKFFKMILLIIFSLPAQSEIDPTWKTHMDDFFTSKIASIRKGRNHPLLAIIDDIMEDIYRIDVQVLRELAPKDIGPGKHIQAEELRNSMSNQQFLVVNVLTANWYEDCHIVGSINVPLKEFVRTVQDWDRDQPIVVYCALEECDASEKADILLRWMGFNCVLEYKGGIKEWFQLGYPVEGPCQANYLYLTETSSGTTRVL